MRVALVLSVAVAVAVAGALLFEAVGIGGLAWYGLVILAVLAGTLADREGFYGR